MGDLRESSGGNEKSPGPGRAQGQLHQVEFLFGLPPSAVGFDQRVNRIGPRREQFQLTAVGTELVLPVEDETAERTAFAVVLAAFLFTVDDAVAQFGIVAAEIVEFADEILFGQDDDLVFAVLAHADKAVELVAHHGILALDLGADITVFAVPADLDVVEGGLLAVDLVEVFDLGAARVVLAVLVDEFLQIRHGIIAQVIEMLAQLFHGVENLAQFLLVFLDVEAADAAHGQRQQFVDVLVGDVAHEQGPEGCQSGIDLPVLLLLAAALFDALVDAVLEEYLRQRLGQKQFRLAPVFVFKFEIEVFKKFLGIAPDHLMHGHLHRLAVADDRHVDGDRNGAVRIHVEGLKRLFGIGSPHGNHTNLHIFGGVVVDAGNSYLVFLGRLFDGGHETLGGGGRGNLADDQFPAVDLDPGTEDDAAVAVIVLADIHESALEKIGIKFERLPAQGGDLGLKKLIEVVGHDARGHAHGDAVAAQHEKRRDLHGQNDGFPVAAVVGIHKFRDLVRKQHLAAQRRETALDVPGRGGGTAGEDVAEISLPGDEVFLVGQHHQCVADGGVAVGMVVHGVADDVGGLVGSAVIDLMQDPEDAALHGFETVVHVGNGAVLDDIGGVIEEVAVHHGAEIGVASAALADGGLSVALGLGDFGRGGVEYLRLSRGRLLRGGIFGNVTHTWKPPDSS